MWKSHLFTFNVDVIPRPFYFYSYFFQISKSFSPSAWPKVTLYLMNCFSSWNLTSLCYQQMEMSHVFCLFFKWCLFEECSLLARDTMTNWLWLTAGTGWLNQWKVSYFSTNSTEWRSNDHQFISESAYWSEIFYVK